MLTFVAQPHHPIRLGDFLRDGFKNSKWIHFRAAIAFVKKSGAQYINAELAQFLTKGEATVSVGISHGGSSIEGLMLLVNAIGAKGKLWVYKNPLNTFHPKLYLFKNADEAELLIGSGNLTKGGLFENAEAGVRIRLNLKLKSDVQFLKSIEETLDLWSVNTPGLCMPLDWAMVSSLQMSGEVPTEAEASAASSKAASSLKSGKTLKSSPFKSAPVQAAPPPTKGKSAPKVASGTASTASSAAKSSLIVGGVSVSSAKSTTGLTFGMTLQNTDVGVGQTSAGTQRRSPEVFIPLAALDLQPGFWGWQNKFKPDLKKYKRDLKWRKKNAAWIATEVAKTNRKPRPLDKLDWTNVPFQLAGHAGTLIATIWFNPQKKDIRIREPNLRGAGAVNDILLIRQAAAGSSHRYEIEVIPKLNLKYNGFLARLTQEIINSPKKIGYF